MVVVNCEVHPVVYMGYPFDSDVDGTHNCRRRCHRRKKREKKCAVRIEPRISNSFLQAYRLQARDVTSCSTEHTDVSEKPDSVLQLEEFNFHVKAADYSEPRHIVSFIVTAERTSNLIF